MSQARSERLREENDKFDSYHYFLDHLDAKEADGQIRIVIESKMSYEEVITK